MASLINITEHGETRQSPKAKGLKVHFLLLSLTFSSAQIHTGTLALYLLHL